MAKRLSENLPTTIVELFEQRWKEMFPPDPKFTLNDMLGLPTVAIKSPPPSTPTESNT